MVRILVTIATIVFLTTNSYAVSTGGSWKKFTIDADELLKIESNFGYCYSDRQGSVSFYNAPFPFWKIDTGYDKRVGGFYVSFSSSKGSFCTKKYDDDLVGYARIGIYEKGTGRLQKRSVIRYYVEEEGILKRAYLGWGSWDKDVLEICGALACGEYFVRIVAQRSGETNFDVTISPNEELRNLGSVEEFKKQMLRLEQEKKLEQDISRVQMALDEQWQQLKPKIGRNGVVTLSCRIGASEGLVGVRISKSSGDATIDHAVLSVARSVSFIKGLSDSFVNRYQMEDLTIRYTVKLK